MHHYFLQFPLSVSQAATSPYGILFPIAQKNNAENMAAAMQFMNDICTYDPMYITSSFNSGELIISYLMFTKNRLEDIRDSLRI